ncbi:hypothetical protein NE237_030320 [Protea cynaroides]|uniref:Uncharacterized protein n=1 Tax=Protea cynaroides TaxID=273540 RepID=A0A9Q0GTH7_9MAGN|nr:hypothetical protein NE237_030320 [Protea cynaroides]
MTDVLSPNLSMALRQRAPLVSHLQSPTSLFFLGFNNDQLECAQARAARAMAICRMPVAATALVPPSDPCLSKEQIIELSQNCVKFISKNVCDCPLLNLQLQNFIFSC